MDGFLCYEFGGLIFGGAYFRNFSVYLLKYGGYLQHFTQRKTLSLFCFITLTDMIILVIVQAKCPGKQAQV